MASAHGAGDRGEPEVGVSTRDPGHELAQGREHRGIDLADMAGRLNLPERQLDALERGDYQQLPPPAFVRGYLRAYAREVGLDGDAIVAAYDALGVAADDPEIRPLEKSSRAAGSRATIASLVVLIGVVAAAFGGWLWQTQQGVGDSGAVLSSDDGGGTGGDVAAEETTSPGDDTSGSQASDGAEGGGADSATDDATNGAEETTDGAGEETAVATDAAVEGDDAPDTADVAAEAGDFSTAPAPAQGTSGDSAGADAARASETQSPAASADTDADDTPGDAAVASANEGSQDASATAEDTDEAEQAYEPPNATSSADRASAPAAGEGPKILELEVAGRSWIEVYDDRGRQLVYTLYSGETPLRLRGWAPFEVFLGNSPAVRVRYEGDAVTKSAFTRSDETARFLVDADGARRR